MNAATFLDTGYILALVNTADQYHDKARLAAVTVQPPFVTTEAVLAEIGNALSKADWRQLGIATLEDLRSDPDIEVVTVGRGLFDRAVTLYSSRTDNEWGLTDCISFVVMNDRHLSQALTTDQSFEQAGFQSVLLKK